MHKKAVKSHRLKSNNKQWIKKISLNMNKFGEQNVFKMNFI